MTRTKSTTKKATKHPKAGAKVGYIRVSSVSQKTDRQLEGVDLDKVFEEKASAKDAKRPQLQACLEWLREGDELHIHSLDRLARNLLDLQQIVEELTGKGVVLVSHKEGLRFTGEDDPMSKLLLQMMGAVAEFERALIKERQKEGIAAYKKKGGRMGPKPKLTWEQLVELKRLALSKEMNKTELARHFGISRETLYKYLKEA